MRIFIPSYNRASQQKTLSYLTKIGYPKTEIFLCVQNEKDYTDYQKYSDRCTIIYSPANGVSQNRNNILSYMQNNEKAIMADDNIDKMHLYEKGKWHEIKTAKMFLHMRNKGFSECDTFGAKLFYVNQANNLFFLGQKAKRKPFEFNKKGACFFGIIKSDICFDERFRTKEDYDFILSHIASGQKTILANCISIHKVYKSKGGCYEVHNDLIEKETADMLVSKYPNLVIKNGETEVKFTNEITCDYLSPRWTGEIADCSLPVTMDTYNNCSFGCVYCFSQYQRGIGKGADNYTHKKVRAVNTEKVIELFSGENKKSEFYKWIKDKRPIQYGGLSDQFDGYEKKYGVTYDILKYLREINYPICFSTKSAWVFSDPKYQELFKGADNWNMKFSIITLDEEDAKHIEVGVPSPQKRLEAMRIYNSLSKGGTTLRLRPFIIGVSDKTYLDLIRAAADAGATAVTTEFFCLEVRSINKAKEHYRVISERCGFDIVEFYKKYSTGSGYLRLNRKIKENYIYKMKELCQELGMRFYVSDSHFKECSDNCCCCALPPDWEYSRGHFAGALQIAKKTGKVQWKDIEKDMYYLDFLASKSNGCQVARGNSEDRAKYSGMTMKDYLRYMWNAPKRGQSPYKIFERVLKPNGYDEEGNIIYYYNQDVTFEKCGNDSDVDLMSL